MGILNTNKEEFERCVRDYWREYKHPEFIYFKCLEDIKGKKINEFNEDDIKGPIRTFLVNWGLMGRVLFRKENENEKNKKDSEENMENNDWIGNLLKLFKGGKLSNEEYIGKKTW